MADWGGCQVRPCIIFELCAAVFARSAYLAAAAAYRAYTVRILRCGTTPLRTLRPVIAWNSHETRVHAASQSVSLDQLHPPFGFSQLLKSEELAARFKQ